MSGRDPVNDMRDQERNEILIPSDGHPLPPDNENLTERELFEAFGELARLDWKLSGGGRKKSRRP